MPSKSDPILVFREEIMTKIIKDKLIGLAYENKGTFETLSDFYNQFREMYNVKVSDAAIRNWMKELDIKLQSSFQFIDHNTQPVEPLGQISNDDLDTLFDNE